MLPSYVPLMLGCLRWGAARQPYTQKLATRNIGTASRLVLQVIKVMDGGVEGDGPLATVDPVIMIALALKSETRFDRTHYKFDGTYTIVGQRLTTITRTCTVIIR